MRNTYTRGVICEKVAPLRRAHAPSRTGSSHPLRRVGPKGSGRFERDRRGTKRSTRGARVHEQGGTASARRRCGRTTTPGRWGWYSATGSTGCGTRWVLAVGSRPICVTLSDTGWNAGDGDKRGADLREIDEHSDLVVIWGGNPVNTQVNVMNHAMAREAAGRPLVVVDPYRTGTAERADLHLALRPGTDGALACAVMHVLFAEGFADWDYLRRYTDCPDELAAHVATRTPEWAAAITGLTVDEITGFARLYGRTKKSFIRCHHGFSRSRNGAVEHACGELPARGDRRLATRGRRRALRPYRDLSARPHADRGARPGRSIDRTLDQSRLGADPHRRPRGAPGRPAGHRHARAEHEPRDGLPRAAPGAPGPGARTCSCACTSSS